MNQLSLIRRFSDKKQREVIVTRSIVKMALCLALLMLSSCIRPPSFEEMQSRREQAERILVDAVRKMEEGRFEEAQADVKLGLELNPRNAKLYDAMACIAWRRGQKSRAERYLKKAIRIDDRYGRGYGNLAFVLAEKGELDKAKELYEIALYYDPLDARTRNNYSVFLTKNLGKETLWPSYVEMLKAESGDTRDVPEVSTNLERFRELLRIER